MTFSEFKQKQLFSNLETKIKYQWFKNWFHNFFNIWNLCLRFGGFFIITLICAILFFVLRSEALENKLDYPSFNTGWGFSMGSDLSSGVVYFLKSFISILFIVISLIMNKWYLYLCFFVVGVNSLFNVIDKAMVDQFNGINHYDTVVDYIDWPAFNFKNNVADIFIVAFVIISILMIILYIILMIRKDGKENEQSTNKQETNQYNQDQQYYE